MKMKWFTLCFLLVLVTFSYAVPDVNDENDVSDDAGMLAVYICIDVSCTIPYMENFKGSRSLLLKRYHVLKVTVKNGKSQTKPATLTIHTKVYIDFLP